VQIGLRPVQRWARRSARGHVGKVTCGHGDIEVGTAPRAVLASLGRVEHPCSTGRDAMTSHPSGFRADAIAIAALPQDTADQGWSALPRLEISHGRHDGDTSLEGLCPESVQCYLSQVAHCVITKHLRARAPSPYIIFSSLRVCWTQSHAPAEPRGLRPAGFLI